MSTPTTTTSHERREEHEHPVRPDRLGESTPGRAGRDVGADEGEVSALARHRDPSARRTRPGTRAAGAERAGRGVVWVRPSELMTQAGGRVAGAGISFEAELTRRARRAPLTTVAASRRMISRHSGRPHAARETGRADRLPPLSAFGQSRPRPYSWVSRSGIGLG